MPRWLLCPVGVKVLIILLVFSISTVSCHSQQWGSRLSLSKALFSMTDYEVKINDSFTGFKIDQHEIKVKIFFNVSILTKLNFYLFSFGFYKDNSNLARRNLSLKQDFLTWSYWHRGLDNPLLWRQPVRWRMLSCIPGLYPLDVGSALSKMWHPKMSLAIAQITPGREQWL